MLIQLGGVSRILFGRSQRLVSESFELRTRDKHLGFQIEELWAQNQRHVFYQTEGHFPRVGWLDFRDRMVGECWKYYFKQTKIQDACFPCTSVLLEIGWQHSSKLKRIAVALSQESDLGLWKPSRSPRSGAKSLKNLERNGDSGCTGVSMRHCLMSSKVLIFHGSIVHTTSNPRKTFIVCIFIYIAET